MDDNEIMKTPIQDLTKEELERGAEICNDMNRKSIELSEEMANDPTGELQEGFCN